MEAHTKDAILVLGLAMTFEMLEFALRPLNWMKFIRPSHMPSAVNTTLELILARQRKSRSLA